MSAPELKAQIRRSLREELDRWPAATRREDSARICALLRAQPVWAKAQCILCFAPLPSEPDLWPLVTEALALGRRIALPRYSVTEQGYEAALIHPGPRALEPGRFRVLEPTVACPTVDPKQLDLALIPGLGFSLAGVRLGRGKGYYDRLLAGVPGFKCGVAFDFQVTPEIPVEPHDILLNCILTPTRWHPVNRPPRP